MGNETPVVRLGGNAVFMRDIAATKFLRPDLGELLSAIKPQTGEERSAITVPISRSESPDDRTLFEAPNDPGTLFYLPSYRIATVHSGAGEEFRVRFSKGAAGATLEIVLEPYAAEGILEQAPGATPLPHTVSAVLVSEPAELAGVRHEVAFTERQDVDGGVRIALTVTSATDISDLFWALTRPENRARLVVSRLIDIALPVQVTRETIRPERIDVIRNPGVLVVADPVIVDPSVFHVERVRRVDPLNDPDPLLDPAVLRVPDPVERGGFRSRVRRVPRFPGGVEELPNGGLVVDPRDPRPGLETVTLYRRTTRSVEVTPTPQPFVFSPELHQNVFSGVAATGNPGALILDQLEFGGTFHSYYRSSSRPEVAYFLPDAFKLARLPLRPRAPFMSVQFDSADETVESITTTVVLAAAAWTDPDRLADAAVRIAEKTAVPGIEVDLQPLVADSSRLTLRLALPGGDAMEMPGAVIDLRTVLRVGFEVPLSRFQRLFDALQGGGAAMLGGEVEVRLDHPDRPAEKVPFQARFDDLAGDAVDLTLGARPDGTGFDLVLANAIESPVRVDAVRAQLPAGPVTVEGLPAAAPLAPAQSLTLRVVAPAGTPPVVEAEVTALPDKEAIWESICDETTSFLKRDVSVRTPAVMFDAAQGIIAINVEIGPAAGGLRTTVTLEPQTLEATATIALPFGDVVLRRPDPGGYRYRVTAVRADRQTTSDWKTGTSAVLFIVTGDVT